MKIVCISDTHLTHRWGKINVPDGDVLVHAGDALNRGFLDELAIFRDWFLAFPHRHKIFVPGNHDWCFQVPGNATAAMLALPVVLLDSDITIDGVKFYGSPWQPEFMGWAFNLPRGPQIKAKWDLIPNDTDVLITHGPPHGILDRAPRGKSFEHVGCEDLREALTRVKPRLHVFGHVHFDGGSLVDGGTTKFVNAALCNESYYAINQPVVVEL